MQILRPNQTFRILWVVADPSDSTTYYPQVTVKQTLNGTVLLSATNMSLDSTGRYYYDWIVPGDTNGGGTQIDLTVIVYIDSGHTTKSPNYNQENRVYNIFDLASLMRGGGGSSLDETDIARIIKKELALIAIPDYKENFGSISKHMETHSQTLSVLNDSLNGKNNADVLDVLGKLPQHGESLNKILGSVSKLSEVLGGNHGQALEGIQNLAESIGALKDNLSYISDWMKNTTGLLKEIPENYSNQADEFKQALADITQSMRGVAKVLSSIQTVTVHTGMSLPGKEFNQPEEKKSIDYSAIARKLVNR